MKRIFLSGFGILALAVGLQSPAEAIMVGGGGITLGDSWTVNWNWQNTSVSNLSISFIRFDVLPGSQPFETPSSAVVSVSGWTTPSENSSTVQTAGGNAIGYNAIFDFSNKFLNLPSDPVHYVYTSYSAGGQWAEATLLTRTADYTTGLTAYGDWYYKSLTQQEWNPGVVPEIPEPASMLLLGLGLAGSGVLGLVRRRRK